MSKGAGQRSVCGWTGREQVCFPPPMGHRWVYFVVDIADYFLQSLYFNVKTVEFKIGSELDILNRTLSGLREFKKLLRLKSTDWLLPMSKALIYAASLFGTSQGGVMVEVSGQNNDAARTMYLSVFANQRGEMIPSILPSLATQMILAEEVAYQGIVPLRDWLPRERLLEELKKRQVAMAVKTDETGTWLVLD